VKCEDCGYNLLASHDYTEYQGIIRCFFCFNTYETTVMYDENKINRAKVTRKDGYLLKEYEDGSCAKLYPVKN
jgi:hypothetical protein